MSTSIPRVVLIWLAFGQLPPIALADGNAVSRAQEALPVAQIYVEQERAPAAWMEAPGSWARLNSEIVELRQRVVELESRPADEHPLDQHLATPYATNGPQAWFPPASECVNCWERYPTLVINGFIQFDSAWFGESAASRMITGDIADVTAIASRWSYTNLNDKNINGGQLNSIELVLNWYWSRRLKLKLLCSRVFVANTAMGDAELDIFGGRLQAVY